MERRRNKKTGCSSAYELVMLIYIVTLSVIFIKYTVVLEGTTYTGELTNYKYIINI